jgi:hypothetical protein
VEPATALLEESADLFRADVPPRLATVLGNPGRIAGQQGDYARATR